MAKKETAEEKLRKIIEANKAAQAAASGAPAAVATSKPKSRGISLGIKQFNQLIIVCLIASALFMGYEIQQGMVLLSETFQVAPQSISGQTVNVLLPQPAKLSSYIAKIAVRNAFKPYEKPADSSGASFGQVALSKKIAKFKIVGISWLDLPGSATVMLEDTSTGMTMFLKEGEMIKGMDVVVKIIYTDRVVFGHANEEITIKL